MRNIINDKYNENLRDYQDLHAWSIAHYDKFWSEVWDMTGIVSSAPASMTVDTSVPMNQIPEWFPGARLNYAENLLRFVLMSD